MEKVKEFNTIGELKVLYMAALNLWYFQLF